MGRRQRRSILFFGIAVAGVAGSPSDRAHAQASPAELAIDRRLAERQDLSVGDTIELTPAPDGARRRFIVSSIFEPRPDPATALRGEFTVRLHLPDLAAFLDVPDRVDRIGVAVPRGISADSAAARINRTAFGYRAYPSRFIASESSRTFAVVSRFHRAIGIIAIVASAIFLLCIMLLKVEERRLDAAVMRMIGISPGTVFKAFVLEACFVALIGSALGIALAAGSGALTNLAYQRRFDTSLVFFHLTWEIVALGVGLSLALGVMAGVLASLRLLRAHPLALWRRAA